MDQLPRWPITALAAAADGFAAARKIGEGASGEVYAGRLLGEDVALKRLRLPDGAAPAQRAALARVFEAELAALSALRNVRLVRVLGYARDDDPASLHPFVLVLELLQGSLADHLAGPKGEAPLRAPLPSMDRVDTAGKGQG